MCSQVRSSVTQYICFTDCRSVNYAVFFAQVLRTDDFTVADNKWEHLSSVIHQSRTILRLV